MVKLITVTIVLKELWLVVTINYWLDIFSRYDIVNPNITSNVEFHNRYNIIIIPLLEQDQIIIIK